MELHMKLSYDQLSGLLQVCNSAVDEHRALALQKDVNLDAIQDIFFADVFEQLHTNILIKAKREEAKLKNTMKVKLSNAECYAIVHGNFYTYNNEFLGKLKDFLFEQIQKASWRSTALYTSQLQVENFKLLGNGK